MVKRKADSYKGKGPKVIKTDPNKSVVSESEEIKRLAAKSQHPSWKFWGPYLSERQWSTVREDDSVDGNCWESFPHGHAHFRAYSQGEDGLLGICDEEARLCLALSLWNGKDSILKERLFGLTNSEGNHGEDVKECYYYLDSSPTHSYMKALYKYPISPFPYESLVHENAVRSQHDQEFELTDTGVFADNNYWDVFVEYAKCSPDDVLCQYSCHNRSSEAAELHVLPTIWFRNTWSHDKDCNVPKILLAKDCQDAVDCLHDTLGRYTFSANRLDARQPIEWLFTNNETNAWKLAGSECPVTNKSYELLYTKDAFNECVTKCNRSAINPSLQGIKCAAHYKIRVEAGQSVSTQCRLTGQTVIPSRGKVPFGKMSFDDVFLARRTETDSFYNSIIPRNLSAEQTNIVRQAYAGLCWSKQFYCFHGDQLLSGKCGSGNSRNSGWSHLRNNHVISMPDKWEFPWYAAWDLAFHTIVFADIDPDFAQEQLILLLSSDYIHPNGQLPAYEFNFSDVNPPVHALACMHVYRASALSHRISSEEAGSVTTDRVTEDRNLSFLKRCFNALLLNFNWWINKQSINGSNCFGGGFLGLDNISCIDRSNLPPGVMLEQADGSAWMAFYCACMLDMALELCQHDVASYEDMAIKFLKHYLLIAEALNGDSKHPGLWDESEGFYYDCLISNDKDGCRRHSLRIRSLVGLVSLFGAYVIDEDKFRHLIRFQKTLKNFAGHSLIIWNGGRLMLSVLSKERLCRLLTYLLDSDEFLSPFGIRSLSKYHEKHPFVLKLSNCQDSKETTHSQKIDVDSTKTDSEVIQSEPSHLETAQSETVYSIQYNAGESENSMFGGNSNWRGPVWICMNYLIIESLDKYGLLFGDDLQVEFPTGRGHYMSIKDVATELRRRLVSIFLPNDVGCRPCYGATADQYKSDVNWKNLVLFNEYYDCDTGRGCGASHQTGWTALIANILTRLANDGKC